jgi:uncharacterized RDD family membrane protein YckC
MSTPPSEPGPPQPSGPYQGHPETGGQQLPQHDDYWATAQPYQPQPQGYPQPIQYEGYVQQGYPPPGPPYPGQPYQGQPYPDASFQGQYPGQPYQGQGYPAQAYTGQAYLGQAYPGQQVPGYGSWQGGNQSAYASGPYPQAGPGAGPGGPWGYPPAPEGLPLPASPTSVYWPGVGTVAIPGMGTRLLARLIDAVIVLVGVGVLGALVAGLVSGLNDAASGASWVTGVAIALVILVFAVGPALYEIGMLATRGATLGKRMLGVRVVRAEDAQLLGWGRATGRFIVPFGGLIIPLFSLLCWLSPLFDSSGRRRGWHDLVAGSVAIAPR